MRVGPHIFRNKILIMLYIKEFLVMLVLAVIVVGNLGDVIYDYREGASTAHLLMELAIAIVSFALIGDGIQQMMVEDSA